MSSRLWWIVRREYLERVRTRAFVVSTVLVPLLMWGMMAGPWLLAGRGGKPLRVTVVDRSGSLRAAVEQALREARSEDRARFEVLPAEAAAKDAEAAARARTLDGTLDGYLVLPHAAVDSGDATYYGRNVSNRIDLRTMERALGDVVISERLGRSGLDPRHVRDMMRGPQLKTIQLSSRGAREDRGGMMLMSILLMMMLYISIQMWGQAVMTGVIEEKSSRVLEVLASAMPSTVLLTGKLLGIGAAGLTQFLVWAASLATVSVAGAAMGGGGPLSLPDVGLPAIAAFVLYFLLGYFLYAALFAAVGAAVNTVQEAQSFAFPVFMPLILGMVFFPLILESPDSGLSVVLSLVPLVSPLLMFLRILVLTPPAWQVALSFLLLALSIWGVVWFSARIYRVGILMYGKKPTFPELLRWVRHS